MERFHRNAKILASIALIYMGYYYSANQPGPRDVINGSIVGLAMYAIWFAQERTK